jgi:predicted nucleic acid-binding protein
MAFWDTSALLKLYVRERDSDRFREMMRTSAGAPAISQLTLSEMHRALWAKTFARVIRPSVAEITYQEFRRDVGSEIIEVIPYDDGVRHEFDRIVPIFYRANPIVPIRTLDGVLLASALVARTPELVSTDSRMRKAGSLLGLRILPDSIAGATG